MESKLTTMAKVDVQAEVMDRALEAPDILANLTFGGAMVTTNGVGMIMNPMGLFSCWRFIQTCCCPAQVMPTIPYVNGGESIYYCFVAVLACCSCCGVGLVDLFGQ